MAATDLVVLGIDTATVVSVGLAHGDVVLGGATVSDRMAHVEQLTPLIAQVLGSAGCTVSDVNAVVVGLGPGPFTGLRVGIATAQVLGSVLGVAVHGVCTLDVLAYHHAPDADSSFLVATDARRSEVYWAQYDSSGGRMDGPHVSSPDRVPRLPTVGPGAGLYREQLEAVDGPRTLDPGVLASAGPRLPSAGTEPMYLRRPDAAEPAARKPVLVRRAGRGNLR